MFLLFIVNAIVVVLFTREFCQKLKRTDDVDKKPFYKLKSALTAMWLPAVVGDRRKMFIAASLSTLITKILMLIASVILAFFFQEKIHPLPFILWSGVGKILIASRWVGA